MSRIIITEEAQKWAIEQGRGDQVKAAIDLNNFCKARQNNHYDVMPKEEIERLLNNNKRRQEMLKAALDRKNSVNEKQPEVVPA